MKPLRILLVYAAGEANATLSYQHAWPRQFLAHSAVQCTPIDLLDRRWHARLARYRAVRRWRGDAVVLLHSVFSNARLLDGRLFDAVRRLSCGKAFFIGNEYKLMREKMRFCDELGVSLLVSQTTEPAVHALYRERLKCPVVGIPNTGFDPERFRPLTPVDERPIDLGYRAAESPWYLGHQERRDMADYFVANAPRLGLSVDVSLDPADRFRESDWAVFLNRCKGQLGTEAGGDYFELSDETRLAVNRYMTAHPDAAFSDIRSRFFDGKPVAVPMRILSGRNVEAAGTRTVQLLFRGRYDGYFEPDVHYIPLNKDFTDIDDALAKFRDQAFSERVAENAYELVLAQFTYHQLLSRFTAALREVL